jgi:hypothetical protein
LNDASTNSPASPQWLARLAPWLIVLVAAGYYGSYIGFWFNPHDEGGTAVLTAMRLLAGDAPIRDVALGYNVGWFWPIVALFKITGVNFLVLRGYFFALSTLTALLGWTLVRRLTRNEWLALGVGLGLVLFPGSQFKNYNPLLCVANMLCIVNAALGAGVSVAAFWRRLAWGGLVLGLTLLTRIDLGYLFGLLWCGLFALRLCEARLPFSRRLVDVMVAAAILTAGVVVTHAPVWLVAKSGGYEKEFVGQYRVWVTYLGGEARAIAGSHKEASRTTQAALKAVEPADRTTLPRIDFATARSFENPDKSVLFFLTYFPMLIYALLLGWAACRVLAAIFQRTFTAESAAPLALLALIGSMASFPQFFFFRPDRPHLSEFMPGYIVATTCALVLLGGRARWFIGGLLAVQLSLFGWYALGHYSGGTIAARWDIKKNKRQLFTGANGVKVWVHKEKDYPVLEGVRRAVVEHSRPGDWLVCYPYQPGYNVMTDRLTYEHDLYQDNATTSPGWSRQTIARLQKKNPAVVVIDDRAINRVESSRFSLWAKPVHEYLRANYQLCATFDAIEVFARDASPAPEKP